MIRRLCIPSSFKALPQIGMTSSEVENSQWGKPTDVNRTITANGVSEQWVYGSGKYIYITDGVDGISVTCNIIT